MTNALGSATLSACSVQQQRDAQQDRRRKPRDRGATIHRMRRLESATTAGSGGGSNGGIAGEGSIGAL